MKNPNRFDEKVKHQIRRENAKVDKLKRKRAIRPLTGYDYYESEWKQEVEAYVNGRRRFDVV